MLRRSFIQLSLFISDKRLERKTKRLGLTLSYILSAYYYTVLRVLHAILLNITTPLGRGYSYSHIRNKETGDQRAN